MYPGPMPFDWMLCFAHSTAIDFGERVSLHPWLRYRAPTVGRDASHISEQMLMILPDFPRDHPLDDLLRHQEQPGEV